MLHKSENASVIQTVMLYKDIERTQPHKEYEVEFFGKKARAYPIVRERGEFGGRLAPLKEFGKTNEFFNYSLKVGGILYYFKSTYDLNQEIVPKLSLDILRNIENTITFRGTTFSPVRELIHLHLIRCRHSEQYIREAFIKPIESRIGGTRTKLSDYVFFKLWNDQTVFMMNLLRMSDQPHWLYAKLDEWGFDLRDRVDHTLVPLTLT